MKLIEPDAKNWRTTNDFYESVLPALSAPDWHGHNLDVLWDSVVGGDINEVDQPFSIRLVNVPHGDLREFLVRVEQMFREPKAEG